jgi:hypothetical protein
MNEEMSSKMKKITRIYSWVIPMIVLLSITAAFLIGGIALKLVGKNVSDVEPEIFSVYSEPGTYSELKAVAMTEAFATDFKETNNYYFVYDEDILAYIVQINGKLSDDQQAIQDFLYSEEEIDAADGPTVQLLGMSEPIEDDIRELAIENYNAIWGEEFLTEENFSEFIGESFLNTSIKPPSAMEEIAVVPFAIAILFAVITFFTFLRYNRKTKTGRETLANLTDDKLLAIDRQLQHPATISYEKQQVYLTQDYVISNMDGLTILPYETISRVYTTNMENGIRRLKAETADLKTHTLVLAAANNKRKNDAFNQIADEVRQYILNKKEELIDTYSVNETASAATAVQSYQNAETKQNSNVLTGLIGALLGSLVGVALWVLIGQLNFIAGIAGLVILNFAVKGYTLFGRGFDRKGAMVCVLVAIVMIFNANILDYAIFISRELLKFDASFDTIRYVFANFFELMGEIDAWRGFLVDLAIGYGLSLWSSFHTIKSLFK